MHAAEMRGDRVDRLMHVRLRRHVDMPVARRNPARL
jgi:hypothetical protein